MQKNSDKDDSAYDVALRRIEDAYQSKADNLDLSALRLQRIPEEIEKLGSQLTELDLSNNQLIDIKPLSGLSQLTELDLSGNQLDSISPLSGLSQLNQLGLSYNQLSDMRPLSRLSQLTELDLSGNQLIDIRPLSDLSQLTELDLSGNQLDNISPLSGLSQLTRLDLSGNRISDIKPLSGLSQLNQLGLSENKLSDIRPLSGLSQLTLLLLSSNKISDIRPLSGLSQLTELDLSHNKIEDVRPLIPLLEGNEKLAFKIEWKLNEGGVILKNNPLAADLLEKIEAGREAVLDYFQRLEEGEQKVPDNELKVLLIGNGSSGKTTLADYLSRLQVKNVKTRKQKSTHGLAIKRFPYKLGSTEYYLNLFDFGGQEYYHDTHHLFFSHNSLYLLLWRPDRNFYEPIENDQRLKNENFPVEYWLGAVNYFSSLSYKKHTNTDEALEDATSLLLLQNSFPKEKVEKEEAKVDKKPAKPAASGVDTLHLKKYFSFIDTAIELSLNPDDPHRIGLVPVLLNDLIPGLAGTILEGHKAIRNRLLQGVGLEKTGKVKQVEAFPWYVRKEDLTQLFQVPGEDNNSLFTALQVMEVKGLVLTARLKKKGSEETEDYVVLKPKELSQRIYKVLSHSVAKTARGLEAGEFDQEHLNRALKSEKPEVIQLVKHFLDKNQIVFKLGDRYVAPQYLSLEADTSTRLFLPHFKRALYRYNYQGFLHRNFIIRIFSDLKADFKYHDAKGGRKYAYWRNGFILSRENEDKKTESLMVKLNRALNVIEFYQVEQQGKPSRLLLSVLDTIDLINTSMRLTEGFPLKSQTIIQGRDGVSYQLQNEFDWEFHYREHPFVNLEVSPGGENFIPLHLLLTKVENNIHVFQHEVLKAEEHNRPLKRVRRFEINQFEEILKVVKPLQFRMKKVFISYSSKDSLYREELDKHLMSLKRRGLISSWHDRELLAGENWDPRIKEELEKADVIILLVSSDFIATDYIWTEELSITMKRHKGEDEHYAKEIVVMPVMLRHCVIDELPFAEINMPLKAKPVTAHTDRDEAWTKVIQYLEKAIKEPHRYKTEPLEENQPKDDAHTRTNS
mgnify:CR=1 FL=1